MARQRSKITYNLFPMARFAKVDFHGSQCHPLYITLTFERKTTTFKSYFFNLFVNDPYKTVKATEQQVIDLEIQLIRKIIADNEDNFSLELFKDGYERLGFDLLARLDSEFKQAMIKLFESKGMLRFATMIRNSMDQMTAYELYKTLVEAVKPSIIADMTNKISSAAASYLPLARFVLQMQEGQLFVLPVFKWKDKEVRQKFAEFLSTEFPQQSLNTISRAINALISADSEVAY